MKRRSTAPMGALAQCERRYLALAGMCSEPVLIESGGTIVFANRAAGELFAANGDGELVGKKLLDVISFSAEGANIDAEVAFDSCRFARREARQMVVRMAKAGPGGVRSAFPERTAFRDMVADAIAAADRAGQVLSVMIVGIDELPAPLAPHRLRDAELAFQETSSRIIEGVRESDTIASVGAHEYAILLDGLGDAEQVAAVAQRKLEAVAHPIATPSGPLEMTASIGVAILSEDVHDADALIASANRALIGARNAGGNAYRVHSRASEGDARRRAAPVPDSAGRLARLTPRELEVLDLLVVGKASKMIAYLLGTSARTVEGHRARVMQKMHADSLAALVTMTLQARG